MNQHEIHRGKKKIRIGVMGCASIAKRSMLPAILESDLFSLTVVASRSEEKARDFGTAFACATCVGYDTLLERDDIDAVYIPLPTGLHREWITRALNAEKHVLAEKSIACTLTDAQEMVRLASSRSLALMENYMFQYHPQHQIVQQWLAEKRIGELRLFRADFGFPPLPEDNFRYDDRIGGGALLDAAGYTVRALQFLLGDTFQVKAATLYSGPVGGTNRYGSAFLTNNAGTDAQLAFGMDHYYQCKYTLWGSKGKITSHWAFTPKPDSKPVLELETPEEKIMIEATPNNHFSGALTRFAELIHHSSRKEMYDQILAQSLVLEDIRQHSKLNQH
jgi:predicted dehydrogenase